MNTRIRKGVLESRNGDYSRRRNSTVYLILYSRRLDGKTTDLRYLVLGGHFVPILAAPEGPWSHLLGQKGKQGQTL